MEEMHKQFVTNYSGYSTWHKNPHHKKVHWVTLILVAIIVCLLLQNSINKWKDTVYNFVVSEFGTPKSTLWLDPESKTVKVGETFPVNIVLDTGGDPIDGVDIYSIHYDPKILNLVDDDTKKNGVQISPGSIMDFVAVNSVDTKSGTIKFSSATQGGANFKGKGVLAVIHFKAAAAGVATLKFDFEKGATKDTNVAYGGRDQLSSVAESVYKVIK